MVIAVIFAGGVGSRMRSKDIPKQFLVIHGEPIIVRTVRHFQEHPQVDSIVVVSVADWLDRCRALLKEHGMDKVATVVAGGATGQESIYHGLCEAERIAGGERAVVLVHDGVRPLIDADTITRNIEAVEETGSAVTCRARQGDRAREGRGRRYRIHPGPFGTRAGACPAVLLAGRTPGGAPRRHCSGQE